MNRALRAAAMGALLLSPVALAACSAGQVAQTATQQQNLGNEADVGPISLRAVQLACPPERAYSVGDDVRLLGTVASTGEADDTLVSIQSDAFSGVQFVAPSSAAATTTSAADPCPAATSSAAPVPPVGTAAPTGAVPTGTAAATGTPSSSAGVTTSPTPSLTPGNASAGATTAAPSNSPVLTTPAGASTSSATGRVSLTVPADGSLLLGSADGAGPTITLTGLNRALTAGQFVRVTFTFQQAGAVTMEVPVGVAAGALPRGSAFDYDPTLGETQQGGGSA